VKTCLRAEGHFGRQGIPDSTESIIIAFMKRRYMRFIAALFFLPLFCYSQGEKIQLNANAGCNISRHYLETIPLNRSAGLNLGLNGLLRTGKIFGFRGSLSWSRMSSWWSWPFLKIRNDYLELSASTSIHLDDDIILYAGLNHAELLSSKFLRLDQESTWQAYSFTYFDSHQSVDLGVEIKLQKNFSLTFDYFIPLKQYDTKNFRTGINMWLTGREKRKPSPRIAQRQQAIAQINELKNGTLLVRLHSSQSKTEWLKEAGKERRAIRTQSRQEKENRKIVSAFRKNFHFCPVMFFYSSNSEKILQKDFSGIFLNDSLLPDSTLAPDITKKFFIAEFTDLEPDTQKYFSGYRLGTDTAGNRQTVINYYGATNFGFYALVIRDENFAQLRKPFPYYSEAIQQSAYKNISPYFVLPPLYFVLIHHTHERTIQRMNFLLNDFYERTRE
jgi:hypothetical protein